jgi:serine/threonine protein kinase
MPTSLLTPYSTAVDIWAIGTLVQEALTGKVPFYHPEPSVMALKAQFAAADRLPACISPECQAFVDAALHKHAAKRPTAVELLQHPWVVKHAAAAAAVVAARVKAKFLAELHIDRCGHILQNVWG